MSFVFVHLSLFVLPSLYLKHSCLRWYERLSGVLFDRVKNKAVQTIYFGSCLCCNSPSSRPRGFHGNPEHLGWMRLVRREYCRLWGMVCERSTRSGAPPQLSENNTGRQHCFVLKTPDIRLLFGAFIVYEQTFQSMSWVFASRCLGLHACCY